MAFHSLADVVAACATARYCTPAQLDHTLSEGAEERVLRSLLVSGATVLAEAEGEQHPEGTTAADIARREEILDSVLWELELRRVNASARGFWVLSEGDDEYPPAIVYADTRTAGAGWADALLN